MPQEPHNTCDIAGPVYRKILSPLGLLKMEKTMVAKVISEMNKLIARLRF